MVGSLLAVVVLLAATIVGAVLVVLGRSEAPPDGWASRGYVVVDPGGKTPDEDVRRDLGAVLVARAKTLGADEARWLDRPRGGRLAVPPADRDVLARIGAVTPSVAMRQVTSAEPYTGACPVAPPQGACDPGQKQAYGLGAVVVRGDQIAGADAQLDPVGGGWVIVVRLDASGRQAFREATRRAVGKQIAILVGEDVLSAPTIQGEIPGDVQLSGSWDRDGARALAASFGLSARGVRARPGDPR